MKLGLFTAMIVVFVAALWAGCQAENEEAVVRSRLILDNAKAALDNLPNPASYSVVPWGGNQDQKYYAYFSLKLEKDLKDRWRVTVGDRFGKYVGLFDGYVASALDYRSPTDGQGAVYGRVGPLEDFLVLSSNYGLEAKRRSGPCLLEYQVSREETKDYNSYSEWQFKVLPKIIKMECDFSKKPRSVEEVYLFSFTGL